MNTAILLVCVLIPIMAASLFYVSDRREAAQGERASPLPVGDGSGSPSSPRSDGDDSDEPADTNR